MSRYNLQGLRGLFNNLRARLQPSIVDRRVSHRQHTNLNLYSKNCSSISGTLRPFKPPGKLKRAREESDTDCAPAAKHRRPQWPTSPAPSVERWVLGPPRPTSVPLALGGNKTSAAVSEHIDRPKSLPSFDRLPSALDRMSQRPQDSSGHGSTSSGHTSEPGTSSHLYRSVLYHNNVIMDYRGKRLPKELQDFRDTAILKQRGSPQLGDDTVFGIMDTAEELADSTEHPIVKLIRTPMFPFNYREGLREGGNTQWPTEALPNNPLYQYSLAAPKPDIHLGYATGQRSDWTVDETNVIEHRKIQPYA